MAPYQPIGTGYKPIGTGYKPIGAGYQPIGTGYNSRGPNTGYGVTGALDKLTPKTQQPQQTQQVTPSGSQPVMSNPTQYLTGGQQSPAQNMLTSSPLDAYDSVRDVNGNGIIDPWEM